MEEARTNTDPTVSRVSIKATIPVAQYANIMPEIEMQNVGMRFGLEYGLDYIKELFTKYSEKGSLKEQKIITTRKSFTENIDIQFDEIKHEFFHNGTLLTSATNYIKRFYKEFQADAIATASAKAWGVDENELKELWKSNGELTSDIGTAIHKSIEHYHKFKKLGKIVQDKKKLDENYAMPKHPLLKAIIKGFIEIDPYNDNEVMSEVLLTDVKNGLCGITDEIIITGDKKCVIGDYKINIDSEKLESSLKIAEPFQNLPNNKLSKYQLQLSLYANMLEKVGWTVEGLVVFVYENGWQKYELSVLKII